MRMLLNSNSVDDDIYINLDEINGIILVCYFERMVFCSVNQRKVGFMYVYMYL